MIAFYFIISHQTVPSEELGPAAAHIRNLGFGVPYISKDDSALLNKTEKNELNSSNNNGNSSSSSSGNKNSESSNNNSTNGSENDKNNNLIKNENTETETETGTQILSDTGIKGPSSGPIPRVYPPSKPHHGSGRQAEPLIRLRDELRKGVDR